MPKSKKHTYYLHIYLYISGDIQLHMEVHVVATTSSRKTSQLL